MEFHEHSQVYPLMPAHELGRLEQAMRDRGYDKRFPIVRYQGKILDGRNRWLAAQAAKVKPPVVDFKGDDDAARQFVITANEERRHLAPQWLEQRRRERIDRMAELRRQGESLRAIADKEGISKTQVERDLSTVPPGTVEPPNGQVVGKDKKKRPAKQPKPTPAEELAAAADEAEPEEERTVEEEMRAKNAELEGWCRGLTDYGETMPDDPWLRDMNRRDGAKQKLKGVCETVRSAKCVCVCPKCEGGGCRHCHQTGRLTRYAKEQLG